MARVEPYVQGERFLECKCGNLIQKRGETLCVECRQTRPKTWRDDDPIQMGAAPLIGQTVGPIPHGHSHEATGEAAENILAGVPLVHSDNWKHRSAGMTCSSCMWFVEKVPEQGVVKVGRCRKHAPTLQGWPAMKLGDWCGDHKLDEEKI